MPMEMALEVSVRPIGRARSAAKNQTLPKTGADLARYPRYDATGNHTRYGRKDLDTPWNMMEGFLSISFIG